MFKLILIFKTEKSETTFIILLILNCIKKQLNYKL